MATQYVVLRCTNHQGTEFELIGRSEASSSEAAIRQVVLADGKPVDGSYVASPERSFIPVPVKVEIPAPRLIMGDAPAPAVKEAPAPPKQEVPTPPKQEKTPSQETPLSAVVATGRAALDDDAA
jgi:hypothetical protein